MFSVIFFPKVLNLRLFNFFVKTKLIYFGEFVYYSVTIEVGPLGRIPTQYGIYVMEVDVKVNGATSVPISVLLYVLEYKHYMLINK